MWNVTDIKNRSSFLRFIHLGHETPYVLTYLPLDALPTSVTFAHFLSSVLQIETKNIVVEYLKSRTALKLESVVTTRQESHWSRGITSCGWLLVVRMESNLVTFSRVLKGTRLRFDRLYGAIRDQNRGKHRRPSNTRLEWSPLWGKSKINRDNVCGSIS